jgi:D-alanyl-D-alanine dipeptidase
MAVSFSGLHPQLKNLVRNLPRVAAYHGIRYRITSAYRSPQKQAALYRAYLAGTNPYPVAPPGTSLHEKGLAIDIVADDQQKLASLLTSAGLSWGGTADPVHFQLGAFKSKQSAHSAYYSDVGSSIPAWATQLPIVGKAFSVARDPQQALKYEAGKFVDIILALF